MGFQSEQRTLWQAPDTYSRMSPFNNADKIKAPLLLVHGDADNNPGTHTMQSERFYAALKAHGAPARLVLLPHESHSYGALRCVFWRGGKGVDVARCPPSKCIQKSSLPPLTPSQ